jgi:hypothetical protein
MLVVASSSPLDRTLAIWLAIWVIAKLYVGWEDVLEKWIGHTGHVGSMLDLENAMCLRNAGFERKEKCDPGRLILSYLYLTTRIQTTVVQHPGRGSTLFLASSPSSTHPSRSLHI